MVKLFGVLESLRKEKSVSMMNSGNLFVSNLAATHTKIKIKSYICGSIFITAQKALFKSLF
jgi:hypothetical protein